MLVPVTTGFVQYLANDLKEEWLGVVQVAILIWNAFVLTDLGPNDLSARYGMSGTDLAYELGPGLSYGLHTGLAYDLGADSTKHTVGRRARYAMIGNEL